MFALGSLSVALTVGGIALASIATLAVATAGTYGLARFVKNRRAAKQTASAAKIKTAALPGLPDLLGGLGAIDLSNLPPEVKQVINVLLPAVHQAQQTVVNAAVAKMFPALSPFIPGIDRAIAGLDDAIDAKLGIGQTPGDAPAIVVPQGHPILDLLQKTLEARQAQREQAGK